MLHVVFMHGSGTCIRSCCRYSKSELIILQIIFIMLTNNHARLVSKWHYVYDEWFISFSYDSVYRVRWMITIRSRHRRMGSRICEDG